METEIYRYEPDYAVSPGEVLEETIAVRGIKKVDLAKKCGLSAKTISLILSRKAPLTPDTAIQLERVVGISASIWNNLEANYRLHQARLAETEELGNYEEWLKRFPIKQLIEWRIIKRGDTVDLISQLLDFFEVGSVTSWEEEYANIPVSFRHSPSFTSDSGSLATWLQLGVIQANKIACNKYNKSKFSDVLVEIRHLTREDPGVFAPRMRELCMSAGVALVFVPQLQGARLCGATRWLSPTKALIELNLRHKWEDIFWFTFYHEAGHILMHGKREVFLDEPNWPVYNDTEYEANNYAANSLIQQDDYARFIAEDITPSSILTFAEKQNIAPGIVVGRLQHDKHLSWGTPLNSLRRKFCLTEQQDGED